MPRGARSDWGSVTEVERGRRYRLRYWAETPDGYRRVSETVRGTRRQATDLLAQRRVEHSADAPCPTVRYAYERWWLPRAEARLASGDLARNTFDNYATRWRRDVGPRFGDVPCDGVRPMDVQRWLDPMTQKPAVDSLALLRQVLDLAATYDVVSENVARRRYAMPRRHEDRKDGAYALPELDAIARAARGMRSEAAIILMCFGSCRTGESLGVRPSEVAPARSHGLALATARIVRQVNSDSSLSPDGVLKNPQSVRTVVVPPPWAARLLELAGEAAARGDAWLCDDGCHRPLSQNRMRAEWSAAVAAACLPARQPRAARRSWETYMRWDMRVERSMVEQMMGHALPGVTGAHYDRPDAARFVDVVAEAFAARPFATS